MLKPKLQAQCRLCKHWQPKYAGVGTCRGAGAQDAKFWLSSEEGSLLFTKADFACLSFAAVASDVKDDIL
jgi:hypothetical protein